MTERRRDGGRARVRGGIGASGEVPKPVSASAPMAYGDVCMKAYMCIVVAAFGIIGRSVRILVRHFRNCGRGVAWHRARRRGIDALMSIKRGGIASPRKCGIYYRSYVRIVSACGGIESAIALSFSRVKRRPAKRRRCHDTLYIAAG